MKRLPAIAALFLLPGVAFGQLTAPSVSVTAGDQTLTIAWDEPSGATIGSAYDLWYILSSELSGSRGVSRGYLGPGAGFRDQPAVPVWTQLPDVASGKGDHYVILPRSLTNGSAYSVKVRHRQGTDDASSTVVEGTPSEPSSTVALTLGTVVGGVVEDSDTDTYSATARSNTTMVCYVQAPDDYRQIRVTTSPDVEYNWESVAGRNRRFVIQSGTQTFTISRGQASGTVEYETVCSDTPAARSISRAHAMDIRYPADLEFGAKNDSFFYSFRITASGAYAIGTAGFLDPVLKLYDSSGTLLRNNDDAWQLGNVYNAAILESLTVDTDNDDDPGLYYVEVHLPYNTAANTGQAGSERAAVCLAGGRWRRRVDRSQQPSYRFHLDAEIESLLRYRRFVGSVRQVVRCGRRGLLDFHHRCQQRLWRRDAFLRPDSWGRGAGQRTDRRARRVSGRIPANRRPARRR